jgi:hypothetical protein
MDGLIHPFPVELDTTKVCSTTKPTKGLLLQVIARIGASRKTRTHRAKRAR